jgi:toxin ParE1/3/4
VPKQRRISWRPSAREDLADILDRISEDSPQAAENLFDAIERSVQILPRFPLLFRESERMPGMRQIPVFGSFLVFYRVQKEVIEVVGVAHSRRKFPIRGWESR